MTRINGCSERIFGPVIKSAELKTRITTLVGLAGCNLVLTQSIGASGAIWWTGRGSVLTSDYNSKTGGSYNFYFTMCLPLVSTIYGNKRSVIICRRKILVYFRWQ